MCAYIAQYHKAVKEHVPSSHATLHQRWLTALERLYTQIRAKVFPIYPVLHIQEMEMKYLLRIWKRRKSTVWTGCVRERTSLLKCSEPTNQNKLRYEQTFQTTWKLKTILQPASLKVAYLHQHFKTWKRTSAEVSERSAKCRSLRYSIHWHFSKTINSKQ